MKFLLLAFGITWGAEVPYLVARAGYGVPMGLVMPLMVVAAVGPAIAALVLTPRGQRRELWRWRVRGNGGAIAIAVLCVPVLQVIAGLVGGTDRWIGLKLTGQTIGIAVLSPVGEEVGWRGYLLPRLEVERRPVWASVIVGVAWCAWHIPYDGIWPAPMWILLVAWSVIITRLWRASDRSLAVAVAAHLGIHVTRLFRVAEGTPSWTVAIVAAVAAVVLAPRARANR